MRTVMERALGKQFIVEKEDVELIEQFPIFVKGYKFQVIYDDLLNGFPMSIVGVIGLNDGKITTISDIEDSLFYCFFSNYDIESEVIKEIDQNPISIPESMNHVFLDNQYISLYRSLESLGDLHGGSAKEITSKASDYIKYLEQLLGINQ